MSKSLSFYMRTLHRDLGFFIIGLTIIFSLSGIVLVFRDTDFLKKETQIKKDLKPGLNISQVQGILHMRNLEVESIDGDNINFPGGTYNSATGHVEYTTKALVFPFNKITDFHKTPSPKKISWLSTIFGVLLFFMAFSSFWMLKRGSNIYNRGVVLAIAGIIFAIILVLMQ